MAESRSDTLIHSAHKSVEQFDYFMMAIISATVAFFAKEIEPQPLTSTSFDVSLAAFTFLLTAMYCGFMRIESFNGVKNANAEVLSLLESRGRLTKALGDVRNGGQVINNETGQIWDATGLIKQIKDREAKLPIYQEVLKKVDRRAILTYKLRNSFFLYGFIALFLAKVLKPYLG